MGVSSSSTEPLRLPLRNMAYVRTGGMSTASRRRRRTTALVLTGLTVLLVVVLIYAVAYFQGWVGGGDGEDGTDSSQASATAGPGALEPADVTVNVYNAKGEPGLAGRISTELRGRNFVVDATADDPQKAQIDHTADIRFGPDAANAAKFLQQHVPGSKLVPLEREGEAVDLVLGDAFQELAKPGAGQPIATS